MREGEAPARHLDRWITAREQLRAFIETELWSAGRRSYLMKPVGDMLDCGVLLAARRGLADPKGERMQGTIRAIQRGREN